MSTEAATMAGRRRPPPRPRRPSRCVSPRWLQHRFVSFFARSPLARGARSSISARRRWASSRAWACGPSPSASCCCRWSSTRSASRSRCGSPRPVTSRRLVLILQANGYWSLYWGTFVLSLGNGAVEAGINPLIAREFRHDKTTWLNRLHAGWPAGFVLGGLLAMMFPADMGWRYQMGLILIPVVTYIVMLLPRTFPPSERVAARCHVPRDARRSRRHQRAGRRLHDDLRTRPRARLVGRHQVGAHRRADGGLRPLVTFAGPAAVHRDDPRS